MDRDEFSPALANASYADQMKVALASGRDSASRLAAIVDSSEDAIIGKSLDGIITSWNLGAEQMYGYRASEALGRHMSFIVPADTHDPLADALARIAHGGVVEHLDTQRVCKDGTILDISVTITPIRDSLGATTGASATGRNITHRLALERERRILETRLNQAERLESLGQLAGGIAHDFNNLLGVILNYASFIGEEIDTDKEAARSDLGQIRAAAERASALTRQLLAFARREVLQPRVIDLNEVISGVEDLLRRTIGEHVELDLSLSSKPCWVEGDPAQLEQVLMNLSANARDAMATGGVLSIDTDQVEIDESYVETHPGIGAGTYARLRVSDTGEGMEPRVLDHVFEPFFTTKPAGEGTGLGLPTVFGIVTQAGGEIEISSELGLGTTCRLLFPSTGRPPTAARPATEIGDLRGTERVLVVEDEDALREVTSRILARNGYQVIPAANGAEAIALASQDGCEIDLLLTDVIMPKMLGNEVAIRIGELRPGLPVLFMSGYARPVLGSTLGNTIALIEKPFSEQLLLTKIRSVLDISG